MRKIFIICPVRKVSKRVKKIINDYVVKLEQDGATVHWPSRNTNQDDPVGIHICEQNREAIYAADEIHIWFDESSTGSLFDLGMTFAFLRSMEKTIVLINKDKIFPTPHKSFQNVILELTKAP